MYRLNKLYVLLIVCSTLLAGCGGNIFEGMADTDTEEAKKEAAKIALDKGDYPEAVSLLEDLCGTDTSSLTCDEDTQADLASAYIAKATDLDVLQLIAAADDPTTGSFTTVSTLLPIDDINDCVDNPAECTMQEDLGNAIEILDSLLPDTVPADPTSEQKNLYLQLATASAVDVAVTIGVVSDGLSTTGLPNTPPTSIVPEDVLRVSEDVSNIVLGLEGADIVSTSLSEDISTIETSMDTNNDATVSEAELISYINGL